MSANPNQLGPATSARIPVAGPWITELERSYVAEAVATNWYEQANDFTGRFEAAFAAHAGRRHAVSLPSCTAGLHLALAGLGVGPGEEVIVPDITWIATAAPISYVGATPVFADVDESSWCLDPDSVSAAVNERTKAIIAVDLYGSMCDFDRLSAVADAHGLALIEDAAEAVGGMIGARPAGSFGSVSTFSFHGSKTLTTGEGGILLTDDSALYERCLVLRDHGRRPGTTDFRNEEVAFKYKMTSMQAALGLAQLERIEELVARKREIFNWYSDRLGDIDGVSLNSEAPGSQNGYWMTTAVWDPHVGPHKAGVAARLAADHIDTRPFFDPLSEIPAYSGTESARRAVGNTRARKLAPRGLNLPSAMSLVEDQVDEVCTAFVRALDLDLR